MIFYIAHVDFQFFLDMVSGAGSLFWMPLVLWVAYFFWSKEQDYPADLEKHIKNGKVWPYLPMYWKGNRRSMTRAASHFLFWMANAFGACALYYLFSSQHLALIPVGLIASMFIGLEVRRSSTKKTIKLLQDRYFQIYTQLASQAMAKGAEISDSELQSRTQWQHQNDLRQADKQGRFIQYLRGEAML